MTEKKKIPYYGSKAEVYHGNARYTKGGLEKKDLILKKDRYGNERYKSKAQQKAGKKKGTFRDDWTKSMKKARKKPKKKMSNGGEPGPIEGIKKFIKGKFEKYSPKFNF